MSASEPAVAPSAPVTGGSAVPLIQFSFSGLEEYMAAFRDSITVQFRAAQEELKDTKQTVADLQNKVAALQSKASYLEQAAAAQASQQVNRATFGGFVKRLAQHINAMDATYVEGDAGPCDWMLTFAPSSANDSTGSPNSMKHRGGQMKAKPGAVPQRQAPSTPVTDTTNMAQPSLSSNTENSGSPTASYSRYSSNTFNSTTPPTATPPATSGDANSKLRGIIRSEISQWYEDCGLPEAEARHVKTLTNLTKSLTSLKEAVNERVSIDTCSGWMESLKVDVRGVRDDTNAVKKRMVTFETTVMEALDHEKERALSCHEQTGRRIDQWYGLLGMSEPPLEEGAAHYSKPLTPPPLSSSTTDNTPSGSAPRASPPSRKSMGGQEDDADANTFDSNTRSVLKSEAFVALRQSVLHDIVDRISSSRHAQASDVGIELYAMRNDVKQRPTAQRVVEIIREQVNIPLLISRCDHIQHQLEVLEKNSVSTIDFNSGMKTKADVIALERRVDLAVFDDYVKQSAKAVEDLDSKIKHLMIERVELSKIFRDVLAYYNRDTGSGGGGIGYTKGGSLAGLTLAERPDDEAARHLQTIIAVGENGDPRRDGAAEGSMSRQESRSSHHRKHQQHVIAYKPITQPRSATTPFPPSSRQGTSATPLQLQRTSGSLSGGPGNVSPPPLPTTSQLHGGLHSSSTPSASGGAVVPLTSNQEAYARHVSEEMMTRQQFNQLPPIPYERAPSTTNRKAQQQPNTAVAPAA